LYTAIKTTAGNTETRTLCELIADILGRISVLRRCGLLLIYYRRITSVWSVCRSVCHDREPRKNGWTDRDAVLDGDSGGPN